MGMIERCARFAKPVVERFPAIARAYRYIRDSRDISGHAKVTPMGFKFLGNHAMEQGLFEPAETEIVKRLLVDADVFINIGANIGYYCCHALQKGKHTIAFEPIEMNVRYLCKNIESNQWGGMIEIYPLALSSEVGVVKIFGGGTGASLVKGWAGTSEQYYTFVPSNTADNVVSSRFHGKRCFILVDIEGAEKRMLEGANCLLSANPKPIWMVEISIGEHQPVGFDVNPNLLATFEIFWNNGYEAWTADRQCRHITEKEVKDVVISGSDTFHTHNFLFIERGKKVEMLGL